MSHGGDGLLMAGKILFSELEDGRTIGLASIELTACPSIAILPEYEFSKDAHEIYQMEMENLLSGISKEFVRKRLEGMEAALEYLLITEPAINQPFAANIRLFINIRIISNSVEQVSMNLEEHAQRIESLLRAENYTYQRCIAESVSDLISNLQIASASMIVKADRIKSIQSPSMPFCYSFDRLGTNDFSGRRLLNELIQYPNCAVSFQLMPAELTATENQILISYSQLLNNLVRGVNDQGPSANVSYTSAAVEADTYNYYANYEMDQLFQFNIVTYGEPHGTIRLSQMIIQEFSGTRTFRTALKAIEIGVADVGIADNLCSYPWILAEICEMKNSSYAARQGAYDFSAFRRFPCLITPEEASLLFHLPIGDDAVGEGLIINESHHSRRSFNSDVINSGDIQIGRIRNSLRKDTIGMKYRDLTKHMLVTGTPGSGKTTFLLGLLDHLWNSDQHIPFLVIEPAKNEYRSLIKRIPDLQVFTPGKSDISPFIFNPFLPPKNVKLESFRSSLFTAFAAAVSMQSPLDRIFEESIVNCYGDFRWFDSFTTDSGATVFNISDFISCFQKTFNSIGYSGDAKNIGKAGIVRLKGLEHLFDNYNSIPIEDILKRPTLIELSSLENNEQKTLIIALVLLSILNYVNANRVGLGELKNILLLEEAHVLMDAQSNAQRGEADPTSIAKTLITRMLAEIRSYGVGMILADQSPRKVGADVMALTDAKLSFRLVEEYDRKLVAASTGLNESQSSRLSKLKPGEAMFFFGRLDEPEEVIVPNYRGLNNLEITISDEELKSKTTYWQSHGELLKPYPECAYCPNCVQTCNYTIKMYSKEIARRLHQRFFSKNEITIKQIKTILLKLKPLVESEMGKDTVSIHLVRCVRIHLVRLLHYNNRILTENSQTKAIRIITPKDIEIMSKMEE